MEDDVTKPMQGCYRGSYHSFYDINYFQCHSNSRLQFYGATAGIKRRDHILHHANHYNLDNYPEFHKNALRVAVVDQYYLSMRREFINTGEKKKLQGNKEGHPGWCVASSFLSILLHGTTKTKDIFISYLENNKWPPTAHWTLCRKLFAFPPNDTNKQKNYKALQIAYAFAAWIGEGWCSAQDKKIVKDGKFVPQTDEQIQKIKWTVPENITYPDEMLLGVANNKKEIK